MVTLHALILVNFKDTIDHTRSLTPFTFSGAMDISPPFYRKGLIEQAIEKVTGEYGVEYFVSAGNFGSNGFESTFLPVSVPDSEGG